MVELGLDYKLSKNWLLGLNYELLQQSDYPHNRLFLQVRYRF
jgi:opacity protein-like surface antigen